MKLQHSEYEKGGQDTGIFIEYVIALFSPSQQVFKCIV